MSATKLQAEIERLAKKFADDLLELLGAASFQALSEELGAVATRRAPALPASPRRGRPRSDMTPVVDQVVSILRQAGKQGMLSEQLRRRLGAPRPVMLRALAAALESKRIRKTGSRRSTIYFVR
jgi:hypothetical protein